MTPYRRKKIIKDLNERVKTLVEEHLKVYAKPSITQYDDGSFGVSTTQKPDDCSDHIRNLSWAEFERSVLWGSFKDEIEKNIPRFERLVRKMKRRLKEDQ